MVGQTRGLNLITATTKREIFTRKYVAWRKSDHVNKSVGVIGL
jgi:hypothetical protein